MIRYAILAAALLVPAAVLADDQDATKLAQEILDKSTLTFESHDASAVAATFTEEGVLILTGKDKDSGTYKSHATRGRDAIEKFYRNLFRGARSDAKAKNIVEVAHFIAPDLLLIHGHFQPDSRKPSDEVPFTQLRAKSGDQWQILSLQVFLVPAS